ncbi:MAG: hypothetical protein R3264_09630 [Anaerolineae bacterium]|nr:hypothetical protein [Anaerolineae bacterium]
MINLNSDTIQVLCQGCHRKVVFDVTDCPWCGASLAYGQPILPVDEIDSYRNGTPQDVTQSRSDISSAPSVPRLNLEAAQISLQTLRQSGLPLEETTYLTIGGGLGSFTWIDHLLIHGADPAHLACIGLGSKPYARCRRLCHNSQISDDQRLRSDSGATPDNIWGWPGYALREIWADLAQGRVGRAARLSWQIFSESLTEPFTPKAGNVFASIDREARRIGWDTLWRFGRVQAIRQTTDGRYVVVYDQSTPRKHRPKLMVAAYLHIALGYPQLRFLPDLQNYRANTGDFQHFVNAYEPHDHIYEQLRQQGGTVLLRGRGITASRIIQRLDEVRQARPNLNIVHLMRHPIPNGTAYQGTHRLAENHFELQPFNFPKSAFGGEYLFRLAQADEQERAALIRLWGGTTTARHTVWRKIINTGLAQGWYQIRFGELERVDRDNHSGRLTGIIRNQSALQEKTVLPLDFIIDATGLDDDPQLNPVWKDLLETYGLKQNPAGKLHVSRHFELPGLQNGTGRVFASGIAVGGGHFAPVDSFIGLQYAAQCSLEALLELGGPGLHRLTPVRSARQWLRWVRGVQP